MTPPLTPSELDALKKWAEHEIEVLNDGGYAAGDGGNGPDPDAVLAVLDERDRLRTEIEGLKNDPGMWYAAGDELMERKAAADNRAGTLRLQLKILRSRLSLTEQVVEAARSCVESFDAFGSAWERNHPSIDAEALYDALSRAVEALDIQPSEKEGSDGSD